MSRTTCLVLLTLAATAAGCRGPKVMVPPRIDLHEHEVLAVIEFSFNRDGELGTLATSRFIEEARRDQGLVRIIELGTEDEVLREVDRGRLDRTTYQEVGHVHDVATIISGELVVSDIRPAISITRDLRDLGAAADVDATLTVRMVESTSGASIWSRSASATRRVGQVSVLGGRDFVFDADDPERAYGELVNALVGAVTADFRVSWTRR